MDTLRRMYVWERSSRMTILGCSSFFLSLFRAFFISSPMYSPFHIKKILDSHYSRRYPFQLVFHIPTTYKSHIHLHRRTNKTISETPNESLPRQQQQRPLPQNLKLAVDNWKSKEIWPIYLWYVKPGPCFRIPLSANFFFSPPMSSSFQIKMTR